MPTHFPGGDFVGRSPTKLAAEIYSFPKLGNFAAESQCEGSTLKLLCCPSWRNDEALRPL